MSSPQAPSFTMSRNPHLLNREDDYFHHLGFSRKTMDIEKTFHDVKVVCMSGSTKRITEFAKFIKEELGNTYNDPVNICGTDRYVVYKVGPVLAVSHGMGVPSITILLHELFKLLDYANAEDVLFIRMGTCGGIGIKPGTVVVSKKAVDGLLRPYHEQMILGRLERYVTDLDSGLSSRIIATAKEAGLSFDMVEGDTMCCDDFYEGQCRVDGAFCNFSSEDKLKYLKKAQEAGVVNIEMESLAVASLCKRAGVKAAVVCIALVNRLDEDEVSISPSELADIQTRPWKMIACFLKSYLVSSK